LIEIIEIIGSLSLLKTFNQFGVGGRELVVLNSQLNCTAASSRLTAILYPLLQILFLKLKF